jgi:hypothetical protein
VVKAGYKEFMASDTSADFERRMFKAMTQQLIKEISG